ncbi:hypothetical protein DSC45_34680 [Streptomyces sp. YIM 130001]|uniref:phosphotransferase family protein n=1 Tax=Streptomyces sp. YIM 130001 TaxID=2259644 RepID=UPI000E655C0F|nr:aminoglycoside phosphotransferase [Streptomyces sp. YIM 130001]RII06976.1 hypothetical protein DSC45_34680 [Streptomyces sp. YIM 130001]
MPTDRHTVDSLPPAVISSITAHTGPIEEITESGSGFNSEISARIQTSAGAFHLKGLRAEHPRGWTQQREADTSPYVTGISPALRWRIEVAGWDVLVFDHVTGLHADYRDSTDLAHVTDMLTRLSEVHAPHGIELKEAGHRLRDYLPADTKSLFAGNQLVHTDLNHTNVLITGDRALLVDWAWGTRGPAWLDAAWWALWLIADGEHTPHSAEQWAARVPAYRQAPEDALDVFSDAMRHLWGEIAENGAEWAAGVHRAAQAWATHRLNDPYGRSRSR